jgi:hypothetical protein
MRGVVDRAPVSQLGDPGTILDQAKMINGFVETQFFKRQFLRVFMPTGKKLIGTK